MAKNNNKSDTESEEEDNVQVDSDLPNEQWLPVPDEPFNKTFAVSNMGRIKNIKTGKIKALSLNKGTHYYSVRLDIGKKHKKITYQIHQLVAKMFIGECPDKYIINHKDLNKQNNAVSNLEYISSSANRKHYLENKPIVTTEIKADKKIAKLAKYTSSVHTNKEKNIEMQEIKDFSKYLIDRNGNVYIKSSGKLKLPFGETTGYSRQTLIPDDTSKYEMCKKYVHRLVAETYIPNPNNLPFVNHKDANRKNNSVENLEWCTASENMLHDSKLRKTGKKIQAFTSDGIFFKEFDSIKSAARGLKIQNTSITKVISGERNFAGGYIWKQINEDDDNNVSDVQENISDDEIDEPDILPKIVKRLIPVNPVETKPVETEQEDIKPRKKVKAKLSKSN